MRSASELEYQVLTTQVDSIKVTSLRLKALQRNMQFPEPEIEMREMPVMLPLMLKDKRTYKTSAPPLPAQK